MSDTVQKFVRLGDLAEITMGQSPDSLSFNMDEQGLPFLQGSAEFGRQVPMARIYCNPPLRISRPNSILVSVRAPVGVNNWGDQSYCIGRGLAAIKAKQGLASTKFLYYTLEESPCFLHKRSQGSTFLAVSGGDLRDVPVRDLSVATQEKIVLILQSIDESIEKTEILIEKYRQINDGLIRDLFTRGVCPDGKLRPPYEQVPEMYQQTSVGWIPHDWDPQPLGSTCDWFSGGTPSKAKPQWWGGTFPWMSPKDMKQFAISDTGDHVTREAAIIGSRIVPANTVFIVVRGMILAHSFPVVLSTTELAFNQDVKAIIGRGKLSNRFLAYWFVAHAWFFLKKTTESTHGTKRFDLSDIYKIEIGIPSEEEQERIVSRLDAIRERIEAEVRLLKKMKIQKAGLMHDLLTGKVRVKVNTDVNLETAHV